MESAFFKKKDVVLILIIAFFCLAGIFLMANTSKGTTATIFIDGKELKTVPLNVPAIIRQDGFVIEVKNNSIGVIESDCNNKLCVKTGFISKQSQTIVCVPNKLVIQINGKSDTDLVVG